MIAFCLFPSNSLSGRLRLPGGCGGSANHLSQALGTSPVTFGNVVEGRNQTEDVIAVITAVTEQQPVLGSPGATNQAHVLVDLRRQNSAAFVLGFSIFSRV